jgi:DNA-binding beta-propeller fold protein YncE
MTKSLLVLMPLILSAQVQVDTVIQLPTDGLGRGFYIPTLNKLYLTGSEGYLVLDCSTYQVRTQIPSQTGLTHFSWNRLRQKLYITCNPRPDSTLVIDAVDDSVIRWLTVCWEIHTDAYLSDVDRRYKPAGDTIYEFECAADTVIRRLLFGGHGGTCASWDSASQKLYVGLLRKLYVYDYIAESLLKVIDVSSIYAEQPDALVFASSYHRAYVAPFQAEPWEANVGIIDTERDSLVGSLPVRIWTGLYTQVAVDERDGKVYLADNDADPATPDSLWVVDCATDSVLRKVEYEQRGWGVKCMRWVPWSNRLYLVTADSDSSLVVVLDCNTDSVIVPGLRLGWTPQDIQLDPIRERIFIIGGGHTNVYVLRDTGYGGVAEGNRSGPRPSSGLQVQMTPGSFDLQYCIAAQCRVDLSVYDLMGREVRQLVAEEQSAGQHRVNWDCRDRNRTSVPRGVYFIRLDTPGFSDVRKAVVAR